MSIKKSYEFYRRTMEFGVIRSAWNVVLDLPLVIRVFG